MTRLLVVLLPLLAAVIAKPWVPGGEPDLEGIGEFLLRLFNSIGSRLFHDFSTDLKQVSVIYDLIIWLA